MKKIYIIALAIFFGVQLKSYSQKYDEIVEILGNGSNSTYLKDFNLDLKPEGTAKFSIVLSKNIKYEFSFYEFESNQIQFILYKDVQDQEFSKYEKSSGTEDSNIEVSFDSKKVSYDMIPYKIVELENITRHEYIIAKTGIYHMFIKNNTDKNIKTAVLLSFIEKIKAINEVGEITPNTKQNKNQDQPKLESAEKDESYFFVVEEMPKFKGKKDNNKEFGEFMNHEIKYPQEAIDKKIEGTVLVQFVISKEGYIKDAKITYGIHSSLDQEALRVVYSSPKWEPGIQRGHKVNVVLTFPIEFKIP